MDNSIYDYSYNQFLSCLNIGDKYIEADFNKINEIIDLLYPLSLKNLNILGGNILKYSKFEHLIKRLNDIKLQTNLYFKHTDLLNLNNIEIFKEILYEKIILNITVSNKYSIEDIERIVYYFRKINVITKIIFLIIDKFDFEKANNTIDYIKIDKYGFVPIFDKNNFTFFKENVFFNKEDLINFRTNQIQLFQNNEINMLDFASLILFPNGDSFTNINTNAIGNIHQNSIYDIINSSFTQNGGWFLTRNKVNPCKDCEYNSICPPISNYERFFNKFNLCFKAN
jgi:pseudo-rSAM protein